MPLSRQDIHQICLKISCGVLQGDRVAELILNHARANECKDVPLFKKEMAELVDHAVSNTLSLGKVFCLLSNLFSRSYYVTNLWYTHSAKIFLK